MKFLKVVEEGLKGINQGIPAGLPSFDKAVYNTQHKKIIGVVGSPKSGKTAMMLQRYIVSPFLAGANIKWVWYSLEMSKEQIIARLTSMFGNIHSKKEYKEGKSTVIYRISEAKILGMGEERLSPDEFEFVKRIVSIYIDPLMGTEDSEGNVITPGRIEFIEDRTVSNPTGIHKYLMKIAKDNGTFLYEKYTTTEGDKQRLKGYIPSNDTKIWVIIDHLGLMKKEKGFTKKDNIDKMVDDYAVGLRNLCGFTFILLSQLNRGIKALDRIKFSGEELQPSTEDIKDSGSLEESGDIIFAIFNPSTYKHLKTHLGYDLNVFQGSYRSIHCIASRYTPSPLNKSLWFDKKTGIFSELYKTSDPRFKAELESIKLKVKEDQ